MPVSDRRLSAALADPGQCENLSLLADNRLLSKEDPLRIQARALLAVFVRVTTEPVPVEDVRLLEVPHDSPLVNWKHLIRGIQAFYACEDGLCRRFIGLVDGASPPGRAAVVLRDILDGRQPESSAGNRLAAAVHGTSAELRKTLQALEQELCDVGNYPSEKSVGDAHEEVKRTIPHRMAEITRAVVLRGERHFLSALGILEDWPEELEADAWFWAAAASANQRSINPFRAAINWYRCALEMDGLDHPDRENLTLAARLKSIQAVRALDGTDLGVAGFKGLRQDIKNCRRGLSRLGPSGSFHEPVRHLAENCRKVLDLEWQFKDLMSRYPVDSVFARALAWAGDSAQDWRKADPIAEQWIRHSPGRVEPHLFLADSACKRASFSKALKHMENARACGNRPEDIDIDEIRIRLHSVRAQMKKMRPDLRKISEEMQQLDKLGPPGDPEAGKVVAAVLEWNILVLHSHGDPEAARSQFSVVERALSNRLAAMIVLGSVQSSVSKQLLFPPSCMTKPPKLRPSVPESRYGFDIARDWLGNYDLAMTLWTDLNREVFKETDWSNEELNPDSWLSDIADMAARYKFYLTLDAATREGLRRKRSPGRFLSLRGSSLPYTSVNQRSRCLCAALGYASIAEDTDVQRELLPTLTSAERYLPPGIMHYLVAQDVEVNVDELEKVVETELKSDLQGLSAYKRWDLQRARIEDFFTCRCQECGALKNGAVEEDYLDDDDDDDDDCFYGDYEPPLPQGFPGQDNEQDELKRIKARQNRKKRRKQAKLSRRKNR